MTREEAINILHGIQADNLNLDDAYTKDKYEALDMAIKALEQEPCEDAISRDAVKELIKCGESTDTYDDVKQVCKWIDALPSVTQKSTEEATKEFKELLESGYYESTYKPKKWIVHEKPHGIRYLECPYCNIWYLNEHLIRNSYCPNCGTRMIESEKV
jgi:hypothetical protein